MSVMYKATSPMCLDLGTKLHKRMRQGFNLKMSGTNRFNDHYAASGLNSFSTGSQTLLDDPNLDT